MLGVDKENEVVVVCRTLAQYLLQQDLMLGFRPREGCVYCCRRTCLDVCRTLGPVPFTARPDAGCGQREGGFND